MVDWRIARQVADALAGSPPKEEPLGERLAQAAAESELLVAEYTGLRAATPLPPAEAVSRREWARANLVSMRTLVEPLSDRAGSGLGPLAPFLRGGVGLLLGVEVGLVVGVLAQRVLGQYDLVLIDPDTTPRLLFVEPNLAAAGRALGADHDELVRWVALHEVTHALQFAGVPWLREHLGGLVAEVTSSFEVSVDAKRMLRMPTSDDLRGLVEAARRGELINVLADPRQREVIDRIQATMAVVEGHAEHVMDAVGADLLPSLPQMRAAMDRRRRSQPRLARVVMRLVGFDLKLRQYEVGKRFCDAIVEQQGAAALERLWSSPDALPTLAQLDDPAAWLAAA